MLGPRLLMSPRGKPLTQALVRDLAPGPGCLIVCGRFEGVDERVIERRSLIEVSVGDYVLSGGEPAAIALLDAVVRLLPGSWAILKAARRRVSRTGFLNTRTTPSPAPGKVLKSLRFSSPATIQAIARWKRQQREDLHHCAPAGPLARLARKALILPVDNAIGPQP